MQARMGPVVLFGSGEIAASAQPVYDQIMQPLRPPVRVSVLETPAGFQLNSADVAGAVADYIREHLPNYRPQVSVVAARKRDTPYSPDDPAIVAPLLTSQVIFLGPGSPTYAARQLHGSLAWQIVQARHRLGHALILASAATIAASAWAIPVYEIYKVGEELHWQPGLDLFGVFGLPIVFVPHWNNNEGGEKHDTSRCFMGLPRFEALLRLLPDGLTIVGIDEYTALIMDPELGACRVLGAGGVTLARPDGHQRFEAGQMIPCAALGAFQRPALEEGLPTEVLAMIAAAEAELAQPQEPPAEVLALAAQRQDARARRDWAASDRLRDAIHALGWEVRDTRAGPDLSPLA
ncbi:MAG: cysteinyl-tRNA synthetase [Chloroflexota bacterium]